jgi:phage terminase small subunit
MSNPKKSICKKPPKPKLKLKQLRFCEEYLVDLNATQAAIRAGYSRKTARNIGCENLTKPAIRSIIDKKLEECSLGKQETIKLLSDIAQGSLNEYFTTTTKVFTPQVQKPLKALINELHDKIADQKKLIERARITNADALDIFEKQETQWQVQILQYEIELERNPKATRIVDGEPQLVETAELDMAKLVRDKERGKIKTLVPNEYGYKVELYPADAALRDLGRYHGIFEKDNEQGKPVLNIEDAKIVFK